MSALPTVTMIGRVETVVGSLGNRRFMIEGGAVAAEWTKHLQPGEKPWCVVTIWDTGMPDGYLGSYGGEVWPSAWPALFVTGRGSAATGPWTRATPLGLRLLEAAAGIRTDRLSRAMSALALAERSLFESLADPLTLGSDCGPLIAASAAATLQVRLHALGFVDVTDVLEAAQDRTSARWIHFHAQGVSFEEPLA